MIFLCYGWLEAIAINICSIIVFSGKVNPFIFIISNYFAYFDIVPFTNTSFRQIYQSLPKLIILILID
ncbi:MAG: hypothetical protein CLLPBCKN_007323 [Chroococcidiopsis cubana SAG 39.79]|nr:hypothetical protein [Chroococcidiopsis cubana SAG 39.79]PSB58506.1 hypothetical protein C7B79_29775 [Chroococcidiopsis cubana CCALA 043]